MIDQIADVPRGAIPMGGERLGGERLFGFVHCDLEEFLKRLNKLTRAWRRIATPPNAHSSKW